MKPSSWLSLLASIWLAALQCAVATVQKANVQGPDFPIDTCLIIAAIVTAITVIAGLAVAWKADAVEHTLSSGFEIWGKLAGNHPKKMIASGLLLGVLFSGGYSVLEQETDPYTLWIPSGSIGLEHREYVQQTWPATANPEMMLALPASGDVGENVLTASYVQKMYRDYKAMDAIVLDGDAMRSINGDCCPEMAGQWTYTGSATGTQNLCFESSPGTCMVQSVLALFNFDQTTINALTDSSLLAAVNSWRTASMWSTVPTLNVIKTFELDTILGGPTTATNGDITGTKVIRQVMMTKVQNFGDVMWRDGGQKRVQDSLLMKWTADVACYAIGTLDEYPGSSDACSSPSGISYKAVLIRSFNDTFGELIKNDISKVIISYYIIIVYLFLTLGKRDSVHSMIAMACVAVLIVILSFASGNGLSAYFQVKSNPLMNNIPFLLLGLGVDDAFVLSAEFNRHFSENPGAAMHSLTAMTARTGGLSVLVTSLTDALAFWIGSTTKLPALSAFCIYAGCGVIMCFVFIMSLFLPALALNGGRASDNRIDCCCCFKSSVEHKLEDPQGCCGCPNSCQPRDKVLERFVRFAGRYTTKVLPVKIGVILGFLALLAVGVVGLVKMETNFELEWFMPEDSNAGEYLRLNNEYFGKGADFEVYLSNVDIFARQAAMNDFTQYMDIQDFLVTASTKNWWKAYTNGRTVPTTEAAFWTDFWQWFSSSSGAEYRRMIKWENNACNDQTTWSSCQPAEGIAASYFLSSMPLFPNGVVRYNTLYTFRNDLNNIIGDSSGKTLFPYARQFLNWEEVGIIKEELIRNLIIASGVICVIICMLIPKPRISFLVILNILASVIEVVGISHFWGQTFNGVTTIYFLICVGLGVDYSAHIGHIFKDSKGKCEDRAHDALQRIGPSVLNALISTAMAVIILGFAKSFVFEVFFRVLFLVACISGSHGVLLLPVLLSIFGGDAVEDAKGDTSKKLECDVVGKDESKITGSNEDKVQGL